MKTDWFELLQFKLLKKCTRVQSQKQYQSPLKSNSYSLQTFKAVRLRYVRAATKDFTLSFGFGAYAELIRSPTNQKQLKKFRFVFNSLFHSFRFLGGFVFRFVFLRSIMQAFLWSMDSSSSQFFSTQSNSITFVVLKIILTAVYLFYITLTGSTVRQPDDFVVLRVLILQPVEVVMETVIHKTTLTAMSRGKPFLEVLYLERTSQFLCCFVSYRCSDLK